MVGANKITAVGALALGDALAYNRSLVKLYLGFPLPFTHLGGNIEIRPVGITALCNGLARNHTLSSLYLCISFSLSP